MSRGHWKSSTTKVSVGLITSRLDAKPNLELCSILRPVHGVEISILPMCAFLQTVIRFCCCSRTSGCKRRVLDVRR